MVVVASTGTDCWWDLRSLKGYSAWTTEDHCHSGSFNSVSTGSTILNLIFQISAFNLLGFLVSQLRSSNEIVMPSTRSGRLATVFPVTTPPVEKLIQPVILRHPLSTDRSTPANNAFRLFHEKTELLASHGTSDGTVGPLASMTTDKIPQNHSHLL